MSAAAITLTIAAPAVAQEDLPAGVINVRTSPSRTIAWNVRDHTDNSGLGVALVYVDKRLVDKKSQNLPTR
jgi:hypothetical protein